MTVRVAPATGVGTFRAANFFDAADPTGPRGSTDMTRILAFSALRVPSANNETLWGTTVSPGASGGWRVRWTGPTSLFRFQYSDGGSALRSADTAVLAIGPGDRFIMICTLAAGIPKIWLNGVATTGPTNAGYTNSVLDYVAGAQVAGADPAQAFCIAALLASDTVALADGARAGAAASIADDLANGRIISTAAGFDEDYLDARDIDYTARTWTDRISGDVLAVNGQPEQYGLDGRWPG